MLNTNDQVEDNFDKFSSTKAASVEANAPKIEGQNNLGLTINIGSNNDSKYGVPAAMHQSTRGSYEADMISKNSIPIGK